MKEINVFATDQTILAHVHGELMLDTNEGTLIVHGEDVRTSYTFNWDHVLAYTESPLTEQEETN